MRSGSLQLVPVCNTMLVLKSVGSNSVVTEKGKICEDYAFHHDGNGTAVCPVYKRVRDSHEKG